LIEEKLLDDKRIKLLRDAPISKAVNHMSIPAIIGMLVVAIYNIIDTMFVAWLGTEATGATQVVFPIMMLVSAFGLAFGMGGGNYISRLLGANDHKQANKVATVSLLTSIGFGLLFTIGSVALMEPLLRFFGASNDVMAMSKSYGLYILLGSVFSMGNMTMNNMLRSEGSAKLSMIGMATGAVLNIILDPIFIFVLDLGIAGAAIATTLSQAVTFAILIYRYLSHHSVAKIAVKYFRPSRKIYFEMFKVGVPTFFRQVLFSVSIAFLNQGAVTYGGSELLAAVGLVFKVAMLPIYILFGIGQGFQPVVGYNYGAKSKKRVLATLEYSMALSAIIAIVSGVALVLFGRSILKIFKPAEVVMAYGIKGLVYYAFSMVFMSLSNTVAVFYQAIGRGKESLLLAISRQGLFYIPVILIVPKFFGAAGILSAQMIADIFTLILTIIMFVPFLKKHGIDEGLK
jgi:putative MATE family efflux protein